MELRDGNKTRKLNYFYRDAKQGRYAQFVNLAIRQYDSDPLNWSAGYGRVIAQSEHV